MFSYLGRGIRVIFGVMFLSYASFVAVMTLHFGGTSWFLPIGQYYADLTTFRLTAYLELARAAMDEKGAIASARALRENGYFWIAHSFWLPAPIVSWWVWVLVALVALVAVGSYLVLRVFRQANNTDQFLRGMRRVSPWRLRFRLMIAAGRKNRGGLLIGDDLRLPRDKETQGILVAGSSGAGKTAGPINRIVEDALIARKGKLVIYDVKGDFTQQLVGYGNVHLFAPWDSRSVIFDIANELRDITDCQLFAKACIPDSGNSSDAFWQKAPRQILSAVLWGLLCEKSLGWRSLQSCFEDEKEMLRVLGLTPQGRNCFSYFGAEETKSGIMSNLKTDLFWVPFMGDMVEEHRAKGTGKNMSLMDWFRRDVEAGQDGEALVLGYYPKFEDFATKLITVIMDMFILTHNEFREDSKRRRYYIIDELGTLPQISHLLVSGINLLRSKGAVFVLGIQDYASIERVYGQHVAREISNSCATKIFFRMTDAQSKKWVEETIGAAEYKVKHVNESVDEKGKRTFATSYRNEVRPIITAGEVSALPDSQAEFRRPIVGFLLVAGLSGMVAKMKWKYYSRAKKWAHLEWQEWPHRVPDLSAPVESTPQKSLVASQEDRDEIDIVSKPRLKM